MSLTKVSLREIIKQQYAYKLKAYSQVFMSLVIIQVFAILFSQGGSATMGSSGGLIDLELSYYSSDVVIAFTLLWGFITAILITTKAYRNDDFIFVTNRLTSNLSNMLFLLTASVIGAITALMSSFIVKIIIVLFKSEVFITGTASGAGGFDLIIGFFATVLYIFLVSALGYFAGTLIQLNRVFAFVLPILFVGGLILDGMIGQAGIVARMFTFFFLEEVFIFFIVKSLITAGLLFTGAFILSNRMEVKS